MMKYLFHLLYLMLFFSFSSSASALMITQRECIRGTMYGGGYNGVLDSYLSPYSYGGFELRMIHETMYTKAGYNIEPEESTYSIYNGCWSHHMKTDLHMSSLKNPVGNVDGYAAGFRYSYSWLYNFGEAGTGVRNLRLYAGPAVSGYLGCTYNARNGNNPAQLKADVMVDLEAMARYSFTVLKKDFECVYQLNVPLVGCAFSPNYGQSYYEIFSMGQYDHNLVFANPINMPSMRHHLTLELPVRFCGGSMSVGYYGEFMQAKFNGLKYHSYSNGFMLGWRKFFW